MTLEINPGSALHKANQSIQSLISVLQKKGSGGFLAFTGWEDNRPVYHVLIGKIVGWKATIPAVWQGIPVKTWWGIA